MKRYLMKRFALTEKGAADMIKAIVSVTLSNIALMTPVWLLFAFTGDYLAGTAAGRWVYYLLFAAACLLLVFVPNYWQYNATFFATYVESGKRRISLAEKLRKLPLSFFGKKDLADLTNTIMADAETLEHASSHQIPQFYGSLISTSLICIGLFFYKWEMALAAVWPIPVAIFIVAASRKVQAHFIRRQSASKVRLNDAVQEFIETSRDLKSCNAESAYLAELDGRIDDVEKKAIGAELGQAAFIVSAQLILKIGIGTVAVAGSALLLQSRLNVMEFFSFLLVASRLYEPMSGNLINLGMLNLLTVPVERMNEIARLRRATPPSAPTDMISVLRMSASPMTRERPFWRMLPLRRNRAKSRRLWALPAEERRPFPVSRHGSGISAKAGSPSESRISPGSIRKRCWVFIRSFSRMLRCLTTASLKTSVSEKRTPQTTRCWRQPGWRTVTNSP